MCDISVGAHSCAMNSRLKAAPTITKGGRSWVKIEKEFFVGQSSSVFFLFFTGHAFASERIRMATTTSTDNSGLLEVILPPFEKMCGVAVDVIAVGTGKAIKLGETGNVDLILVHAPEDEEQFISEGYGVNRRQVMHNDFILLGPEGDPVLYNPYGVIAVNPARHPHVNYVKAMGTHRLVHVA
jgi:ABC-type tungstate transport system permease subunit